MEPLDFLLASIKQYVHNIKKLLGIPHSQAMELVAKCHKFTNWHDLMSVAKSNPNDPRILSAAIGAKSPPALKTTTVIEEAGSSKERFAKKIAMSDSDSIWLEAKGFQSIADLTPATYVSCVNMEPDSSIFQVKFSDSGYNPFENTSRMLFIVGQSGSGKTVSAVHFLREHAEFGGKSVYISSIGAGDDPINESTLTTNKLLARYTGPLKPGINIAGGELVHEICINPARLFDNKMLLREFFTKLHLALEPYSLVVFDEISGPLGSANLAMQEVFHQELEKIRGNGACVVWLSQTNPRSSGFELGLMQKSDYVIHSMWRGDYLQELSPLAKDPNALHEMKLYINPGVFCNPVLFMLSSNTAALCAIPYPEAKAEPAMV